MINREKLKYYENILSIHNTNVDLSKLDGLIKAINEDQIYDILKYSLDLFDNIESYKKAIFKALDNAKNENEYKFFSELLPYTNKELDLHLLCNVLKSIRQYKDLKEDILDSFSNNQFASKCSLLKAIDNLDIIKDYFHVAIWGSWYGSILIPKLSKQVKKILAIDIDERVGKISKNTIFQNYHNVEFHVNDVFQYKTDYLKTNLFINTSCEHMRPMKEWPWFGRGAMTGDDLSPRKVFEPKFDDPKLPNECYFAFQSNNMFGIEGHINCVNSIDEFKDQLPARAEVLYQEEIEDTRGTRYMLVGKFNPI